MRDFITNHSRCGGGAFPYPRCSGANRWLVALALLSLLLMSGFSSPAAAAGLNGDKAYTEGPQVCGACHAEAFQNWLNHGHSRKLGIGGPALK
ncbi:MAG: hypothetical protein IMF05_03830, partial [Proteobacteria bacterium]|nr:hypothetical protein [Pseudomonadota bacterium]